MQSLVMLARVMSKCATRIYKQHHESLLPVWNAANEIRRELHRLVEQQRKDLNFGLVGDPSTGELGVCQTMVSTSKRLFAPNPAIHRSTNASCSVSSHLVADIPPVSGAAPQAAARKRLCRRSRGGQSTDPTALAGLGV